MYTSSYNITKRKTNISKKSSFQPLLKKVGRETLVQTDDGGSVPEVISQRNTQEIPLPCRIWTANSKVIYKGVLEFDSNLLKGCKIFSD